MTARFEGVFDTVVVVVVVVFFGPSSAQTLAGVSFSHHHEIGPLTHGSTHDAAAAAAGMLDE